MEIMIKWKNNEQSYETVIMKQRHNEGDCQKKRVPLIWSGCQGVSEHIKLFKALKIKELQEECCWASQLTCKGPKVGTNLILTELVLETIIAAVKWEEWWDRKKQTDVGLHHRAHQDQVGWAARAGPSAVRQQGLVTYTGSPQQLREHELWNSNSANRKTYSRSCWRLGEMVVVCSWVRASKAEISQYICDTFERKTRRY